jgi:hypothetical protein
MTRVPPATDVGNHPRFVAENPAATAIGIPLSRVDGNFIPGVGGSAVPFRFDPNPPLPSFQYPLPAGIPPLSGYPPSQNPQMFTQEQSQAGLDLVSYALAHTPSRDARTTVDES